MTIHLDGKIHGDSMVTTATAARMVFPDGSIKAEHLRIEIHKGFLPAAEISGRFVTTINDVVAWNASRANRKDNYGFIYFVGFLRYVKIGFSQNVSARVAGLQNAVPLKLEIYFECPGTYSEEGLLHQRFAEYRLEGEWFMFDRPIREWITQKKRELGWGEK